MLNVSSSPQLGETRSGVRRIHHPPHREHFENPRKVAHRRALGNDYAQSDVLVRDVLEGQNGETFTTMAMKAGLAIFRIRGVLAGARGRV